MRFNPFISIFLGFITYLILYGICFSWFHIKSTVGLVLYLIFFIIGGFLATYFAKKRKIRYGLYEGIPLIIFTNMFHLTLERIIFSIILILSLSSIGGFLGMLTEKNNRKSFNKRLYRFNPYITMFLMLFITIPFFMGLSYLSSLQHIYFINFTFIFLFFIFLGGLIVAWFSKENKIKHSLYYGLILSIVLFAMWKGYFFKYSFFLILMLISAIVGGIIAENEEDTIKNLLNNKFQEEYKKFFVKLFNRNKMFIITSSAIFFVSVLIGGIGTLLSSNFSHSMINLYYYYTSGHNEPLTTFSIFLNNSTNIILICYIGGISFGIISIFNLVRVSLVFGFISVKDPIDTIFYILPHGIFELSGIIIATAAGFKLLITAMNIIGGGLHIKRDKPLTGQINSILRANYLKFRDSLILFIIAIILIFIAAIIEANISIPLAEHVIS